MIPCSEASSPISAKIASSPARLFGTISANPSSSGWPEAWISCAPLTPVFTMKTAIAQTASVMSAMMPARGMTFCRLVRLLRRERQLLDAEEEPHRERDHEQHRPEAVRQERGHARVGLDVPELVEVNDPVENATITNTARIAIDRIETMIASRKPTAAPSAFTTMKTA